MQPMVPQSAAYGAPVAVVYDNGGIVFAFVPSRPSVGEGEGVIAFARGDGRGCRHRFGRLGSHVAASSSRGLGGRLMLPY